MWRGRRDLTEISWKAPLFVQQPYRHEMGRVNVTYSFVVKAELSDSSFRSDVARSSRSDRNFMEGSFVRPATLQTRDGPRQRHLLICRKSRAFRLFVRFPHPPSSSVETRPEQAPGNQGRNVSNDGPSGPRYLGSKPKSRSDPTFATLHP